MTTADGQPQATGVPAGETPDSVLAGPSTWNLDQAHSSVSLHSKTMWGLVTVRGAFGELAGSAEILPGGAARGRLEIGAASLNTKNAKRDKHLASAASSTPPTIRRSWPTWPARPGPVTEWPSRAR